MVVFWKSIVANDPIPSTVSPHRLMFKFVSVRFNAIDWQRTIVPSSEMLFSLKLRSVKPVFVSSPHIELLCHRM